MSVGSSNRYLVAFWKFLGLAALLHLLILTTAHFMSAKTGLFGLKVFWAHISGGLAPMSIALALAILLYFCIYKYWTR